MFYSFFYPPSGLWNPRERQNLFHWLKRVLDQADVPISVFFKTTQLFDRFIEQDVLESMGHGVPGSVNNMSTASLSTVATGSMSTVASSPQTPLEPGKHEHCRQ